MATKYFSAKQSQSQAAGPTEPLVLEKTETVTPIRARHVLILGALSALGPLSSDMYLPALPALSHELGATMAQTQMTLSAGILGLAIGQVLSGPSSDAFGRRRPLLIGMAAFALSSLLCMMAPSVTILTLLRFVQGFSGAAGISLALAIVSDLYVDVARARVFSLLVLVSGLAPILAPVIGSQLLIFTSWHGIFVTLALIGLLLFMAVMLGIGESLPVDRRQGGGITATLQTFRSLLLDRHFLGYSLSSGFAFTSAIIHISVSPFILQNIYGVSPQRLGLIFGINAIGLVIVAQICGQLIGRISPQKLLTAGIILSTMGCISLLVVVLSGIGLIGILPAIFVMVASLGLIGPNATTLALNNTQAAGSAAALLGVVQLSIGAVAAPLVGLGGTMTAVPMAVAIAAFGAATLVAFVVLCRPGQVDPQSQHKWY